MPGFTGASDDSQQVQLQRARPCRGMPLPVQPETTLRTPLPGRCLVGGDWNIWIIFPEILGIIIPIDFHMFQRGRYTTNQICMYELYDLGAAPILGNLHISHLFFFPDMNGPRYPGGFSSQIVPGHQFAQCSLPRHDFLVP